MDLSTAVAAIGLLEKLRGFFSGMTGDRAKEAEGLIELLRTKLELLSAENGRLDEKCRSLEKEISEFELQEMKTLRWYRGLRFRILPSGRMDRAVVCPNCRSTLQKWLSHGDDLDIGTLTCNAQSCGWRSENIPYTLDALLRSASQEHCVEVIE